MAKLPYMQFYPADYLRDTRCLSLAARGAWMDILCTLWNSPKRGKRTLTLEGWAGEIGKAVSEVAAVLGELELNVIGKISHENDSKITISSPRMLRDGRARALALKRKQKQRSDSVSRSCHAAVTPVSQQSHAEESEIRNQKSESEVRIKTSDSESEEEKKEKSGGQVKTLPRPPAKSAATWEAYADAYLRRYHVPPVRNSKTNAQLCQLVTRLGADEAPLVAAWYLTHNKPLYVSARHPTNLLLQDAEGLRTQWATGVTATTSEAKNLELRDNVVGQAARVIANLQRRGAL